MNFSSTLFVITIAVFVAGTAPCRAASLTDLGTLGGDRTTASAINNHGHVVGSSSTAEGFTHAFWYHDGVMTDIGTLGGWWSAAVAINEADQIVGTSQTAAGEYHAFLYSGGVMTDLGTIGGASSDAVAINASGQVIGGSRNAANEEHAFLYDDGVMTDLGALGGWWSGANAINDSGQIVGRYVPAGDWRDHAFLYSDGVMTDLGLGAWSNAEVINNAGQIAGYRGSGGFLYSGGVTTTLRGSWTAAFDINDAGQVVGRNNWHADSNGFLYDSGVMTDLGTLGGAFSFGIAINGSGQVAGWSGTGGPSQRAFLYSGGAISDLGTIDGSDTFAKAINDSGQVLILSGNSEAGFRSFVRNPVCGDAIVDPTEECDDGNSSNGDCCANDCSYPGPATTCLAAVKASVEVRKNASNGRDRLKWEWNSGAIAQSELGDPSGGTTYTVCVSDSSGGIDRLVASLQIAPGTKWTSKDPDGWRYEDASGAADGVVKAKIETAVDTGARIRLSAKGANIPTPASFSDTAFFDQDGRVTVQLFNDATFACWSSEFSTAKINSNARFRAVAP